MAEKFVMKEVLIEKCPFCGGNELIETKVNSYGGVYISPATKAGFLSARLYATVCRSCGSVVRTYCLKPEKLIRKRDRRIQ